MNQSVAQKYIVVDEFNTTYWSGMDVQVKLGDILLDESTQVSYQIQEQVQPYYHYSSYVPNRFNHGVRIIAGEITMNFKQSGYLVSLLNQFNQDLTSNRVDIPNTQQPINALQIGGIDLSNKESLTNYIKSAQKSRELDILAVQSVKDNRPRISNSRGLFEVGERVNLSIVMGTEIDPSQVLETRNGSDFITRMVATRSEKPVPITGRILEDIHFIGAGTILDDTGRPIMETVTFQAANISIINS